MKLLKKYWLTMLCAALLTVLFCAPVRADDEDDTCDHYWYFDDDRYEDYSEDEHAYIRTYYCYYCDEKKEEVTYEAHDWEPEDWDGYYVNYSKDEHKLITSYYCPYCEAQKTETDLEAHNWEEDFDWTDPEPYSDTKHKYTHYYTCDDCGATKTKYSYGDHEWYLDDSFVEKISSTQHEYTEIYICSVCSEEKYEYKKENHKWSTWNTYDYKKKDGTYHTYKKDQDCTKCDAERTVTVKEKHTFNKYNRCSGCGYVKAKNITLKPDKNYYANSKSWLKINISKSGYIVLNVKNDYGYSGSWTLYDSKKNAYIDCKNVWGKRSVAVKKGTYYLKPGDNVKVKYTFKKDPSKKNYTKSSAVTLKKKNTVANVVYANAKKETWSRFYKVELTEKQYLHIKETIHGYYGGGISLYDSKMQWVSVDPEYNKEGDWTGYVSSSKLNKGTYYIELWFNWSNSEKKRSTGSVVSLSWR